MTDESDTDSVHVTPPLADLAGKEPSAPGPLTKPVAIPRAPERHRPRWLLLVILLIVIAAVVGIIWLWSTGAGSGEAIEYTFEAAEFFTA